MSACLLATSALQIAARVVCQQARAIPRRVKRLMCLKMGSGQAYSIVISGHPPAVP